jgi:hypothetical protein
MINYMKGVNRAMREGRRSTYKRGLCGKGFCVEILKVG